MGQEKLAKLRDERKEKLGDVPQWIEERQKLGEEIAEKNKEKAVIRDELRQEKQMEERQAWQKQKDLDNKKKAAERLEEQPYVAEITLIEQTIAFCNSLVQKKGEDTKEEKKETAHDNPEGTEVLLKKEDRDEFYLVPTSKGKKSKSKNKSGKAEGSSKPIKHNAETFRLFDQLKLDAPITTDDIPALLEKLEEQLEMYKGKVKKWEETKAEKIRKLLEGADLDEENADEAEAAKGDE